MRFSLPAKAGAPAPKTFSDFIGRKSAPLRDLQVLLYNSNRGVPLIDVACHPDGVKALSIQPQTFRLTSCISVMER